MGCAAGRSCGSPVAALLAMAVAAVPQFACVYAVRRRSPGANNRWGGGNRGLAQVIGEARFGSRVATAACTSNRHLPGQLRAPVPRSPLARHVARARCSRAESIVPGPLGCGKSSRSFRWRKCSAGEDASDRMWGDAARSVSSPSVTWLRAQLKKRRCSRVLHFPVDRFCAGARFVLEDRREVVRCASLERSPARRLA